MLNANQRSAVQIICNLTRNMLKNTNFGMGKCTQWLAERLTMRECRGMFLWRYGRHYAASRANP